MCGIVGLKPTYGRVSRYGLIAFGSSLDQIGPLTRTVEDAALTLAVIAGGDPADATSAPEPVPDYAAGLSGDIRGTRTGDRISLHSSHRYEGTSVTYRFDGTVAGKEITGTVDLAEYGKAQFTARRRWA